MAFWVAAAIIWVEIKPNKFFKDVLKRLLICDKTKMLITSFVSFELRLLDFICDPLVIYCDMLTFPLFSL